MNRIKKEDLLGIWMTAIFLSLISLLLIGILLMIGKEMAVRLDAQIAREARELNAMQKEEVP